MTAACWPRSWNCTYELRRIQSWSSLCGNARLISPACVCMHACPCRDVCTYVRACMHAHMSERVCVCLHASHRDKTPRSAQRRHLPILRTTSRPIDAQCRRGSKPLSSNTSVHIHSDNDKTLGTAARVGLVNDNDVLPVSAINKGSTKVRSTSGILRIVLERPADLLQAPFSIEDVLRHVDQQV